MSNPTIVVGFTPYRYPTPSGKPREKTLDDQIAISATKTTTEKVNTVANKIKGSTRSSPDASPIFAKPDDPSDPDQFLLFPLEI